MTHLLFSNTGVPNSESLLELSVMMERQGLAATIRQTNLPGPAILLMTQHLGVMLGLTVANDAGFDNRFQSSRCSKQSAPRD